MLIMKSFHRALICIIISSTQFGCGGSETSETYVYTTPTTPNISSSFCFYDPVIHYEDTTGSSKCPDPPVVYMTNETQSFQSQKMNVINFSSPSITIRNITFVDGKTEYTDEKLTMHIKKGYVGGSLSYPHKLDTKYMMSFFIFAENNNNQPVELCTTIKVVYRTTDIKKDIEKSFTVAVKLQAPKIGNNDTTSSFTDDIGTIKQYNETLEKIIKSEKCDRLQPTTTLIELILQAKEGNLFGILGLKQDSAIETVSKRYRNLAVILHPDKALEGLDNKSKQAMERINPAYEEIKLKLRTKK